jgi:microcystin-dependent protein
MEPFIGMIVLLPYNFAPRGYALCNGQILSIAQNSALFSLLGTTYGGNGVTTFALPDLRGRVPISSGQGPGLSNYSLGEVTGVESLTLTVSNMPAHTHPASAAGLTAAANVRTANGNTRNPANALPAVEAAGVTATYSDNALAPVGTMAAGAVTIGGAPSIGVAGSSIPFSIVQPLLTLNYCIALEGIFPSRN